MSSTTNGFTSEGAIAPAASAPAATSSAPAGGPVKQQGLRISIRGTSSSAPETWKGVKHILKKKEYTKFTRTPEVAAAYEVRAAKDLERYVTIGDEIQVRQFGALEAVDPATGKMIAQPRAASSSPALVITPNAFPYNVSKDIVHLVLWSRDPQDLPIKEVKAIVSSTLGIKKKEFLAYENPKELKSVPNVRHWQVFVKAKALDANHQMRGEDAAIPISEEALAAVRAHIKKWHKIGHIALIAALLNPAGGMHIGR